MDKTTVTVAVRYLRISDDKSGDEHGIKNQDEYTGKLVVDRGYTLADCHGPGTAVAGLFLDNDISASKGKHRPGYQALMHAVERGDLDGGTVVVYQMSRLWRNRGERAAGIELFQKHNVSVIAYKGVSADLTTSYGRMVVGLLGELDTWESEVKAERVSDAQKVQVRAGLHPGGHRPFGWELHPDPARAGSPDPAHRGRLVKPAVHKAEAAALRKAAAELLKGRSLASQVRAVNAEHTTTWGGPWDAASLRRTLMRQRNYGAVPSGAELFTEGECTTEFEPGDLTHADGTPDTGPYAGTAWPAIWSEDTHRRLVAVLDDPKRVTNHARSNKIKALLSHVATCWKCGGPVRSCTKETRDGGRRRVYRCVNHHCFRSLEAADFVVSEWLMRQLEGMTRDQRHALLSGPGDNSGPFADKARELRAKMDKLVKSYLDGTTPDGLYKCHMTSLKAQLANAEKAMAAHSRSPVVADLLLADNVRAAWQELPLDRKRSILRELVWVVIQPGKPGRTLRQGQELTPESAAISVGWNIGEDGGELPGLLDKKTWVPGERERDEDD
jgi:DNA invertase Pin-like site-specific DNA recombinase